MPDTRAADLFDRASLRFLVAARLLAEVEGMKAENDLCRIRGEAPAYNEDSFARVRNFYEEQAMF